ncbi:uncharacterized protein LOC121874486 [Homarus americanus]|uniref:Uncharacterized protein n=1 Tax=Homarus americanus TaxID=6706 RepID=A0A8J5JTR3_HOMAM|nr:uncharacterized protein LOC121874486 [Homarus americanus]KAG7161928.1 hypothetical protein Hamer_G019943 [Homarus americanus]
MKVLISVFLTVTLLVLSIHAHRHLHREGAQCGGSFRNKIEIITNLTLEECQLNDTSICLNNQMTCLKELKQELPSNITAFKIETKENITLCASNLQINITLPDSFLSTTSSEGNLFGGGRGPHGLGRGSRRFRRQSWSRQYGRSRGRHHGRPENLLRLLGIPDDQLLPMISCLMELSGLMDTYRVCISQF